MSLSRRSRIIFIFWAAVALIAALEAVLTAAWLVRASASELYASVQDIPAREVGMVLGAPEFSNGRPSPYLPGRIKAAAELYHAGKVRKLVVSGAARPDEFYDEIASMTRMLVELGVPEDAIVGDGKGLRTLDSLLRMRDVFGYDDFITVSQRDHCERALFLADRYGVRTIAFAAGLPPGATPDQLLFSMIREPLARVKAVLDVAVHRSAKYPVQR
ncbi:MAG: ElyC/SanA/YdcF family protein [Lentisphaeria bacterium]|nr:ElyC/SanA/YdcF family protein [Lentisphaeria bacterium]